MNYNHPDYSEPVAEVEEASTPVEVDDEDDDEPSGRVLSKKEKEKLKKEREKASLCSYVSLSAMGL